MLMKNEPIEALFEILFVPKNLFHSLRARIPHAPNCTTHIKRFCYIFVLKMHMTDVDSQNYSFPSKPMIHVRVSHTPTLRFV